MTISLTAQTNTDTLLTQSDSCKVSFLNENLNIKIPSYTFEKYLNPQRPIIIRIRNERQPLVIIDGVISNKGTLGLEVPDIKSISVLESDKFIRIYGEKAKDGVILITTKHKTN